MKGSLSSQKMFILIYTCLNIRALYLDLVLNMLVKSFLSFFHRFTSRLRVPDELYSDNARSFIQEMDALKSFVISKIGNEFLRWYRSIHKKKSPIYPWRGSPWERMRPIVNICLMKTIGRSLLEYFDFVTILSEITDAIYSLQLPYTLSGEDIVPLTTNCFLKSQSKISMSIQGTSSDILF